jgi:hypothetical protein
MAKVELNIMHGWGFSELGESKYAVFTKNTLDKYLLSVHIFHSFAQEN